jgi:hypothetical protein
MTRRHMLATFVGIATAKSKPAPAPVPGLTPEGIEELFAVLKTAYEDPHWICIERIERNTRGQDIAKQLRSRGPHF